MLTEFAQQDETGLLRQRFAAGDCDVRRSVLLQRGKYFLKGVETAAAKGIGGVAIPAA
jgi:hypothetical protein